MSDTNFVAKITNITAVWANDANRGVYGFSSVAAMRAAVPPQIQPPINSQAGLPAGALVVTVKGYYTSGDSGGGTYYFDPTDTTSADNGGTIIVGAAGARWKWLGFGRGVTPSTFGAKGDGVTDDTAAVAAAVSLGGEVIFPRGRTYKITSYIQVPSNTTIHIYGTVQLTGRNSGFFTLSATNVSFYGYHIGTFTDSTVLANYTWNIGSPVAPCIHFRSSNNCVADGLVMTYVSAGLYHSNAQQNSNQGGGFTLSGPICIDIRFANNNCQMVEMGSISGYTSEEVTYSGNYVYRSGDGGIWMMGCLRSRCINNERVSPATTPTDVAAHGANNPAFPTTWNDEQGLEFENCHSLLVQGNTVLNVAFLSIDIKNSCSEISVFDNLIYYPESAGIVVREGDTVKNSCYRISIQGNQIFNVGTPQLGILNTYQGGIVVAESYLVDISDNIINSWQTVPAIRAAGPGSYLASQYPSNPVQATIAISGNKCWFKSTFQELVPALAATSSTPPAIIVNGLYDSVEIVGNLIKADRFFSTDNRVGVAAGIILTYLSANSLFYPMTATISDNVISNWIGRGIDIAGQITQLNSGCVIEGNGISGCGNTGINATNVNGLLISCNNVSNVGSGSGSPGVNVDGSATLTGISICGNNIFGREVGGTNTMNYGIILDHASGALVKNNQIRVAATSLTNFTNIAGEIVVENTSGFPRSGAGSPSGALTPLWTGEEYLATGTAKWWKSTGISANTLWGQITN